MIEHEILLDGIILNLQIIGESIKEIPPSIREKYPDIPWRDIIGLRNIISHTYYLIDIDIIWNIIETEIQPLKTAIAPNFMQVQHQPIYSIAYPPNSHPFNSL